MWEKFYNKTVTVFNQTTDDLLGKEIWYATVLENVRLIETKGANVTSTGLTDTDASKLFIHLDTLDKPYVTPKIWQKLSDKTTAFTFTEDNDFFVLGDMSDVDLNKKNLFSYMKDTYDSVYRVTSVDKYELIPHLEVGGR